MLDFYINFTLNENFDEVINTPLCTDFSYTSFSEGQKQRINLALLFAWREIARIKNSTNVNLLILDEVFDSSLDSTGTEDFLKIIRHKIKDSNTFVISHKENIQDRFDKVIEFRKKGNFSELKVL
jgi:DNA repair exonuclease SbcCD ATPase subunit